MSTLGGETAWQQLWGSLHTTLNHIRYRVALRVCEGTECDAWPEWLPAVVDPGSMERGRVQWVQDLPSHKCTIILCTSTIEFAKSECEAFVGEWG